MKLDVIERPNVRREGECCSVQQHFDVELRTAIVCGGGAGRDVSSVVQQGEEDGQGYKGVARRIAIRAVKQWVGEPSIRNVGTLYDDTTLERMYANRISSVLERG